MQCRMEFGVKFSNGRAHRDHLFSKRFVSSVHATTPVQPSDSLTAAGNRWPRPGRAGWVMSGPALHATVEMHLCRAHGPEGSIHIRMGWPHSLPGHQFSAAQRLAECRHSCCESLTAAHATGHAWGYGECTPHAIITTSCPLMRSARACTARATVAGAPCSLWCLQAHVGQGINSQWGPLLGRASLPTHLPCTAKWGAHASALVSTAGLCKGLIPSPPAPPPAAYLSNSPA